jgi:hypothetical protein
VFFVPKIEKISAMEGTFLFLRSHAKAFQHVLPAQLMDDCFHLGRRIGIYADSLSGVGMDKVQLPRVKQKTLGLEVFSKKVVLLVVTMGGVTNDVMTDMGEMTSDLMHPSRFWRDLHEAIPAASIPWRRLEWNLRLG